MYIGTPVDALTYGRQVVVEEPVTSAPTVTAPPITAYVDQWAAEAERIRAASLGAMPAASPPLRREMPPHARPAGPNYGQQVPPVPPSFAAYGQTAPDSPFHGQAAPAGYTTP